MSDAVSDKFKIEGAVNLTELTKSLQESLADEPGVELEPEPAQSPNRFILEVGALYAAAKGLAALTPLILGVLNFLKSRKESGGGKPARRLVIFAKDGEVLDVPEDTSAEQLKKLLEAQPKFQDPKHMTIL